MAHDAQSWSEWGQGFPRNQANYVALDVSKSPAPVITLPPGGAKLPLPGDPDPAPVHLRTGRGDFHCLVPGCGAFESSVGGQTRRHHFRHHPAPPEGRLPGHDPESLHHRNAKHELAGWLERELGPHLVRLYRDEHVVVTPQGRFEPDVYAELETGARIAVEYQHSPGDPATVSRKQRGYAAAGITCWWIFGPFGRTFVLDPDNDPRQEPHVLLTTVQRDLCRDRVQFHWFNVESLAIGTPVNRGRVRIFEEVGELWDEPRPTTRRPYVQHAWRDPAFVLMRPDPLDRCSVDLATGRLLTPVSRRISADRSASEREVADRRSDARRRFREAEESARQPPEPSTAAEPAAREAPVPVPGPPAAERPALPPAARVLAAPPAVRKPWWKRLLGL